jgi:DNA helicase-2/ATP-dependent DNA helicase PcrA
MVEKRSTVKVRSSGRSIMRAGGRDYGYGGTQGFGRSSRVSEDIPVRTSPSVRRPGTPVVFGSAPAAEDESQDVPHFVIGARVKHRKFGSGTIAELSGIGRDAKVKIDFDDESIGRKTLVIAQANLERGDD